MSANSNAAPLWKTANIEDRLTGRAVEEFGFRKVGGGIGRTTVNRSDVRETQRLLKHLLDCNAALPPNAEEIVHRVANENPVKLIVQPRRMGWQNRGKGFLAATGSIGNCGRREVALPSWMTNKHAIVQTKRGSLNNWVKKVASPSCQSSAALVALCAAFAAPLLRVTKTTPFGINLYGISKAGKTSALLAASSIGGIGVEGRMPNFRSTPAARGELGCAFNDQLLPLNEVGLLAHKNRAYESIRELIYQISEGRDTIRHSESKYAKVATASEFRTIFVATSEHHFDRYAKFAQQRRDEGEYARCLDIAACSAGSRTIIDLVPDNVPRKSRKAWRRRQVINLRGACASQHGHALPAYLSYLIKLQNALPAEVAKGQSDFLQQIELDDLEGALQHGAHNFSLLAAGGRLAIHAKLLPISEEKLIEVLVNSFNRAIGEINIFQSPDRVVRQILLGKLKRVVPIDENAKAKEANDSEAFSTREGKRLIYTVKTRAFRRWFQDDGEKVTAALESLERMNCLIKPESTRARGDAKTVSGRYTKFVSWPHGKQTRCFVFKDPYHRRKHR